MLTRPHEVSHRSDGGLRGGTGGSPRLAFNKLEGPFKMKLGGGACGSGPMKNTLERVPKAFVDSKERPGAVFKTK